MKAVRHPILDPSRVRRVLIIRPSALGDVCRTVPVLVSLRHEFPHARIDWVVQDSFASAIAAHPDLDEVIPFPRKKFSQWWKSPHQTIETLKWFWKLSKRKYDLAIDCQGLGRSGLMTFASAAPRRVGLRSAREFAWLGYNLRVPECSLKSIHTVDQMLALVQALGISPTHDLRLYVCDDDSKWWNQLAVSKNKYAVIAPTSRWESKRWPIERFAELIKPLQQRGFSSLVVVGSPGEEMQVQPLLKMFPDASVASEKNTSGIYNLIGQTTIGQSMAIISQAGLVIANDSAPLHMAVGFDRPCVGLFGPTNPEVVGPYRKPNAVVQSNFSNSAEPVNFKSARLRDSLMKLITTGMVIERIDDVLSK